jgi:predicted acylesterase/phospholipase RssA
MNIVTRIYLKVFFLAVCSGILFCIGFALVALGIALWRQANGERIWFPAFLIVMATILWRLGLWVREHRKRLETLTWADLRVPRQQVLPEIKWHRARIALVLCGGGGKGAYQIGAVKAFYDAGVKFQVMAGTSAGAINASLLAGGGLEKARNLWLSKASRIFTIRLRGVIVGIARAYAMTHQVKFRVSDKRNPRIFVGLVTGLIGNAVVLFSTLLYTRNLWIFCFVMAVFTTFFREGITNTLWFICESRNLSVLSAKSLIEELETSVDFSTIQAGNIPIYVTVAKEVDLPAAGAFSETYQESELELTYVPQYVRLDHLSDPRKMARYITASASIPFGVLEKIHLDGEEFVDGGIVDNGPVIPVLNHRCDLIVVVHTNHLGKINNIPVVDRQRYASRIRELANRISLTQQLPNVPQRGMKMQCAGVVPDELIDIFQQCQIVHVVPSRPLGGLISSLWRMHPARINELFDLGYADAAKILEDSNMMQADKAQA